MDRVYEGVHINLERFRKLQIKCALELGYSDFVVKKIREAKSENEIYEIMEHARVNDEGCERRYYFQ